MTDSELHPYIEWIAREARRPVVMDPAVRDRLMAAIRVEPLPARRPTLITVPSVAGVATTWSRLVQPRFTFSPAGGALLAAGLVGIGILAGTLAHNRDGHSTVGQRQVAVVSPQLPVSHDTVVEFVYVAPRASRVSVVGDFNEWDATKTPMVRAGMGGQWTVTLPLTAGRHLYAFIVDGTWNADPSAPVAPDDGFGHSNSVKIVPRGSTL